MATQPGVASCVLTPEPIPECANGVETCFQGQPVVCDADGFPTGFDQGLACTSPLTCFSCEAGAGCALHPDPLCTPSALGACDGGLRVTC